MYNNVKKRGRKKQLLKAYLEKNVTCYHLQRGMKKHFHFPASAVIHLTLLCERSKATKSFNKLKIYCKLLTFVLAPPTEK